MTGEAVYLYAFDVANEIITTRVREILSERPFSFEIRQDHTLPKDVPLYRPLAIEPPPHQALLYGAPIRLLIRVYDVGVVTVMMRTTFNFTDLEDLMRFHNPKTDDGATLDKIAIKYCDKVCASLKKTIIGRSQSPLAPEAYTVFCFTDLGGVDDANHWAGKRRREIAGLLTETDPENLSEAQVSEVLRIQRSFEKTDLAIIDWDAALAIDLKGYVDDVLYALELANLQLEEFRIMDQRLDRYLDRAYDDLDRQSWKIFGVANRTLRHLRRFRVDVAKLADEVTHITKFFGDWHLARVYLGACDRFYLDQWRSSVEQRLAQLDKLYSVIHSEVNEQRMLWLEIIIVVFFALDLLIMLWR
ncbi:MAG TPA: hypothetical protein VL981_07595 [Candidatus Methylacidiphilales bacterium]|nr:hypothetical protein [Candidatus Methylacidiphilales bacterium]